MDIYASTKTLPYVYKCSHRETGQFYYGVRWANKTPSTRDLGTHYFTSSRYVKANFDKFTFIILAEFFDSCAAKQHEKLLIEQFIDDPLCLNQKVVPHNSFEPGHTTVRDVHGNIFVVSVKDPRFLSGELVGINKGVKRSPDSIAKQQKSSKGHRKQSTKNYHKPKTPEHRARLTQASQSRRQLYLCQHPSLNQHLRLRFQEFYDMFHALWETCDKGTLLKCMKTGREYKGWTFTPVQSPTG